MGNRFMMGAHKEVLLIASFGNLHDFLLKSLYLFQDKQYSSCYTVNL